MFSQYPRESRSKARTGTGTHNHGTAGNRPCGPPQRTGRPNLENEMWNVSAQVINGAMTPEAAAAQLQDGLKKWYPPQQK